MGGGGGGGGGGTSSCSPPDIRLENFATLWTNIFARFGRI